MKKQEHRLQLLENLIYLIIWVVILFVPLWDITSIDNTSTVNWDAVLHAWLIILPFFILFLVNNYVLMPLLLIRKKSWLYLLFTLCTVALIITINTEYRPIRQKYDVRPEYLPSHLKNRPKGWKHPPMAMRRPLFMSPSFIDITMVILILGLNSAIKFLFKSIRDDHRMKELEKQTSETELAYLKHQLNPHFFMNTLNNIHALVDIDKEKAQKTILELSKIMRYILYEASISSVPLEKELHFLVSYIELMKIRYTEQVDIRVSLPENSTDIKIPPLLFISFLENAFEHGISYQHKSFIHLSMEAKEEELSCLLVNSKFGPTNSQQGFGLDNARKRLQLLYNNKYTLHIENKENEYRVLLIIPLS